MEAAVGNRYQGRMTAQEIMSQGGQPLGLACPACGCVGPHKEHDDGESFDDKVARAKARRSVMDTRPIRGGVRRRRVCRACGCTFGTTEVVSPNSIIMPPLSSVGEHPETEDIGN